MSRRRFMNKNRRDALDRFVNSGGVGIVAVILLILYLRSCT